MTAAPGAPAHVVRRLEVADVRVWRRAELELPAGLVVLTGPNGAGKTSLVEAVVLGCLGVSPRTAREAEIVRHGAEALHVRLDLDGPGGVHRREIGFAPGRGRRLRLDDVPVRSLADWRARVLLVFMPDELRAVKGPPAARAPRTRPRARGLGAGLRGRPRRLPARPRPTQRPAPAGTRRPDGRGWPRVWEETMANLGATVAAARRAGVADLAPAFRDWLERLGGGAAGSLALEMSPEDLAATPDDALADALAALWRARRPREIQAAHTLSGPHRDDLWIGAGPVDLRRVGSQGEQRTAALAFLLAARDHLRRRAARPILLLDDVLSELDPTRRLLLLDAVRDGGQTVVTSADPAVEEGLARQPDAVVHVREGTLYGI